MEEWLTRHKTVKQRLMVKGERRRSRQGQKAKGKLVRKNINMGNFQDLKVWQRSKDLAVYIYKRHNKRTI